MPRAATFVTRDGVLQPAPGAALQPHRARDGPRHRRPPGADTDAVLAEFGFAAGEIAALKAARYRRSRPESGERRHGCSASRRSQQRNPRCDLQDLRALRRRLLAGEGPRRRLSRTTSTGRWPTTAGSASPCRRRTAAPASASPKRRVMMQAIAESGAGMLGRVGRAHEHLRPQPGGGVRHRGAEAPLPAAADRRRGEGLLRRHRAQRRPRHHASSRRAPCATATATSSHGQKIWISTAQVADQVLLLARTTPLEEVKKPTEGLTLFYTDARPHATSRCARSTRWAARRSTPTSCSSTACRCRVEDRIGEEGRGFEYILHGMNPERILIAAEAVGIGRAALAARRAIRQGAHRVRPARSARTRRSSIRSPSAGWSSRRPTSWCCKAAALYDAGQALRRRGQRRQVPRRPKPASRPARPR